MVHRHKTQIGPYTVGERPEPIRVTFLDFEGNPLDLTGYSVDFVIEAISGVAESNIGQGAASIVAPSANGVTQYAWIEADFLNPGRYRGQMWVGNGGAQKIASLELWWDVLDITPAPSV